MRRLSIALISAISVIALTQIAAAAPPPPVFNWSGFYIGVNAGLGWGKADTDFDAAPVLVNATTGILTDSFSTPGFVTSQRVDAAGVIGGGQIGYNWQFSPNWVVGVEADIQASGQKGSRLFGNDFSFTSFGGAPVTGATVTDYEAKILWFGTVRGRVGYAWDRVMVYATGGLAYGEVKVDGTSAVSGTWGPVPFSSTHAIGHSQVNTGWTVGAGSEVALGGNWTGKFEYLYMDLGSLDDTDPTLICTNCKITSVTGGQTLTHTHFTDNIFRVGLNYKFY